MALQAVYDAAGRPGAAKLRDATRRRGLDVSLKEAQDFVRGQSTAQVFAPPPKSNGKVTSPQLNERWQADLMDFKAQDPEKNKVDAEPTEDPPTESEGPSKVTPAVLSVNTDAHFSQPVTFRGPNRAYSGSN